MAGKQTLPDAGAFAEVINRMQNERPDDSDFQMTKEVGTLRLPRAAYI